jgi:Tol biopolymer transport system component
MKIQTLTLLLPVLFLLSACQPAIPVATPTNTPTPTSIPSPTQMAASTSTVAPIPTLSGSGGGVIAYAALEGNDWQIYIVNADGSGKMRVSVGVRGGYEPNWSPDGTKIIFQYNGLYIADIASGEISPIPLGVKSNNLPNEYLVKPSWSPDGEWIAFLNESEHREIFISFTPMARI